MPRFFSSSRSSSSEDNTSSSGGAANLRNRSDGSAVGPARLSDIDRARNRDGSSHGAGSLGSLFESGPKFSSSSASHITSSRPNRAGALGNREPTQRTALPGNFGLIPAGGGRNDPRMERECLSSPDSASSYPPRNPISTSGTRHRSGYQKLTWGDFPQKSTPKFRPGTAPKDGDPGYDHERTQRFPEGSQMHTEYVSYKTRDAEADEASKKYKDMRQSYKEHNRAMGKGTRYYTRDQHSTLRKLAEEAGNAAQRHSQERSAFNQKHIGRRTKDSYFGHEEEAQQAETSSYNYLNDSVFIHNTSTREVKPKWKR